MICGFRKKRKSNFKRGFSGFRKRAPAVSDISGRVLYSQSVNAVVGTNTLTVNLNGDFPTGTMLLISLRGNDDTQYETTKVSTQ